MITATKTDILTKNFGMEFMDTFHDYGDVYGNVRHYHRLKAKICANFIKRNADASKIFLDAGAGRGPYSLIAASLYQKIFVYEYDTQELNYAKHNLRDKQNIEYASVDLRNIPLEKESIDVALCSEVLEHIPQEQKAMDELYRVMKPGGRLLFSMPNAWSLFYLRVRLKHNHLLKADDDTLNYPTWEMKRHISFPCRKIERIATTSGFKIIRRHGANFLPLPYGARKFLMQHWNFGFTAFLAIDAALSKLFPFFCSFYFLELKKII